MNEIKRQICDRIESLRQPLLTLSHNIAANPELGYNEYKAVEFIRETVTAQGWEFTSGTAGIDTAFIASKSNGEGPHIAILAEYDALAEVGHACGHNVIATMSTGAFLGLAPLMDHFQGKVSLIGCPAEEGGAGKVRLVAAGVFDDVDYAMMIHPSSGRKPGHGAHEGQGGPFLQPGLRHQRPQCHHRHLQPSGYAAPHLQPV